LNNSKVCTFRTVTNSVFTRCICILRVFEDGAARYGAGATPRGVCRDTGRRTDSDVGDKYDHGVGEAPERAPWRARDESNITAIMWALAPRGSRARPGRLSDKKALQEAASKAAESLVMRIETFC
jgi:hypothetical protein